MKAFVTDVNEVLALSRLFSYPCAPFDLHDVMKLASYGWHLRTVPLQRLQNEYVRLFINSLPEVPCPPYASLYLEGTLLGPSAFWVRNMYRTYGFATEEMPDHFAVELEFLAVLNTLSEYFDVLEDYNKLLEHMRTWIPPFLIKVTENDTTGLYQASARYAEAVLFPDARTALMQEPSHYGPHSIIDHST